MAEEEKKEEGKEPDRQLPGIEPVERYHSISVGGATLNYLSRAGILPLTDEKGKTEAEIFFTAYVVAPEKEGCQRPLTFVFNGGPGSSSIWLHMGACGPRRVKMEPGGWMPAPPFVHEENPATWLDRTDLVFIDPVETGLSRAASEKLIDKFWGYEGDIESVGEFIRLYLSRYRRWGSPLFLAGESYGTTRAAGLADYLVARGIVFNGIVLISTALNLRPIFFQQGDDLPFHLFVPTYAAAAWYHRRLAGEYLKMPLPEFLCEVSDWSETTLALALLKGDRLPPDEYDRVAETLSSYIGIDPSYVKGANLRVNIMRFCKELLRKSKRSIGRLDARFTGIEGDASDAKPEYDPSMTAILATYTSVFNDYLSSRLEVKTDMVYRVMHHFSERKWKWEDNSLPDTGESLRRAMGKNRNMKVLAAQGYYDLATPHMATEYMVSHMNMDPEVRGNLAMKYYHAGHMFYLDSEALLSFRRDVEVFFNECLTGKPL